MKVYIIAISLDKSCHVTPNYCEVKLNLYPELHLVMMNILCMILI